MTFKTIRVWNSFSPPRKYCLAAQRGPTSPCFVERLSRLSAWKTLTMHKAIFYLFPKQRRTDGSLDSKYCIVRQAMPSSNEIFPYRRTEMFCKEKSRSIFQVILFYICKDFQVRLYKIQLVKFLNSCFLMNWPPLTTWVIRNWNSMQNSELVNKC